MVGCPARMISGLIRASVDNYPKMPQCPSCYSLPRCGTVAVGKRNYLLIVGLTYLLNVTGSCVCLNGK